MAPAARQTQIVCVVDDETCVRRALKRLFAAAGYTVETFASAEQYLAREPFEGASCVVLDVRMPGMNGFALQDNLASLGRQEQIVFISGHSEAPTSVQHPNANVIEFLLKPFTADALFSAVNSALDRSLALSRLRNPDAEQATPQRALHCAG
jgi:FixJ family two-component response regulator